MRSGTPNKRIARIARAAIDVSLDNLRPGFAKAVIARYIAPVQKMSKLQTHCDWRLARASSPARSFCPTNSKSAREYSLCILACAQRKLDAHAKSTDGKTESTCLAARSPLNPARSSWGLDSVSNPIAETAAVHGYPRQRRWQFQTPYRARHFPFFERHPAT